MKSMLLKSPHTPLFLTDLPVPNAGSHQVLLKVLACGICRTDLHVIDGELSNPKLPLILGHEIVGEIATLGPSTTRFNIGDKVGVPWLGSTDGTCPACLRGEENFCDHPGFTGYTQDGGFAEYTLANEDFCIPIPPEYTDAVSTAPLLCAGLIGYRTYRMAGNNINSLGIYGFGAAAHIIAQLAQHEGKKIYAFTRPGDKSAQDFALRTGAVWTGDSTTQPPVKLDAALIFAPVGSLVIEALKATRKGGSVVCGGIYMSDIPTFPYSLLWEERVVRSVANLTRKDGEEFFTIAPQIPLKTDVRPFPLESINDAIGMLRAGKINGAAVIDFSLPSG